MSVCDITFTIFVYVIEDPFHVHFENTLEDKLAEKLKRQLTDRAYMSEHERTLKWTSLGSLTYQAPLDERRVALDEPKALENHCVTKNKPTQFHFSIDPNGNILKLYIWFDVQYVDKTAHFGKVERGAETSRLWRAGQRGDDHQQQVPLGRFAARDAQRDAQLCRLLPSECGRQGRHASQVHLRSACAQPRPQVGDVFSMSTTNNCIDIDFL